VSAFGIIKDLTDSLVFGLNEAFAADPLTNAFANTTFTESPASPGAGTTTKKGLSLWPYRITRDEFANDQSLVPLGASMLGIPPLVVDVWYLATPMTGSGDSDQLLLEKTLQYMYDLGPLALGTDNPVITFETPGSDELFRLWSAMETAYSLSCVFVGRHVAIDSTRAPQRAGRVIERYDRYARLGS
jgi:hypothetical protein